MVLPACPPGEGVSSDQRKQVVAAFAKRGLDARGPVRRPLIAGRLKMIERLLTVSSMSLSLHSSFPRRFRSGSVRPEGSPKVDVRFGFDLPELGDDPAQLMMRQVIALFDRYQSWENAKPFSEQ